MNNVQLIRNIQTISIILVGVLLVTACSNGSIIVNGEKSRYSIHRPKGYSNQSEPLPLLLVLHGNPSKGWQMKMWTGMNKTADKHGFIAVYPNGYDKRWPIDPDSNEKAIQLIAELIQKLTSTYNIDKERIYLSGISGGGIFSFHLIQKMPDTFAAFCVVAGNYPATLELISPKPFMYVHGTADYLWDGRDDLLSARETIEKMTFINRCSAEPYIEDIPDIKKKDNSTVKKIIWRSDSNNDVVFYRVENGGHHWPGSMFNANVFHGKPLGPLNKDLDTNEAIWHFFRGRSSAAN